MNKFLSSKILVIFTPIITFIVGFVAGWLLGYQSEAGGYLQTYTEYNFQIRTAIGYWLFALIISLVVLLLCILIKKQYTEKK